MVAETDTQVVSFQSAEADTEAHQMVASREVHGSGPAVWPPD